MSFPYMSHISKSRDMLQVFRGYNHNLRIGDGEWYDESGLSSDDYPVFSIRKPHGKQGYTADKLFDDGVYVVGNTVHYGESEYEDGQPIEQVVKHGNYLLLYPAGEWVDTRNGNSGRIDNEVNVTNLGVDYFNDEDDMKMLHPLNEFSPYDGKTLDGMVYTSEENPSSGTPAPMKDGTPVTYWYNTITKSLFKFKYNDGQWSTEKKDGEWTRHQYIVVSGFGGIPFRELDYAHIYTGLYDGESAYSCSEFGSVVIDGTAISGNGTTATDVVFYTGTELRTHEFNEYQDRFGSIFKATMSFYQPTMDYYIAWNGRIWGCRYGADENGQLVNEIRCTAYRADSASFREWDRSYETDAANSAVFSLTSPGEFTGCAVYNGSLYFFKENTIHRVVGSDFTSFQVVDNEAPGIQYGAADTAKVLNGALYYKGVNAVYRFDGSFPVSISDVFGNEHMGATSAGVIGNKYYLSASRNGKHYMMVYDTKIGCWHIEGNINATSFARNGNTLLYTDADGKVNEIGGSANGKVRWYAETGIIGLDDPDSKYYSQIAIRMSLPFGSSVAVDVMYNNSGVWEPVKAFESKSAMFSTVIPFRPRRCDNLRMRLSGAGDCHIFSITKTIEGGSER